MTFSAAQVALIINGKVEGNPDVTVGSFGKIEEAQPGQLAFLANAKYEDYLYQTLASVVIVNDSLELKQALNSCLLIERHDEPDRLGAHLVGRAKQRR